ncbi:MAG: hypothetical protein WDN28_23535 [Chthoniobacter sp.]
MKTIISDVPCCCETYFGDWFRDHHGFTHANLGSPCVKGDAITPPNGKFALALWVASLAQKIVVTWGFSPIPFCFQLLEAFKTAAFAPWWFTADHRLARAKYIRLHGRRTTQCAFDPQVKSISQEWAHIDAFYGKRKIETLRRRGYLPVGDTLKSSQINRANFSLAAVRIDRLRVRPANGNLFV